MDSESRTPAAGPSRFEQRRGAKLFGSRGLSFTGAVRDRLREDLQNKASGLNLMVAAIILWNTPRYKTSLSQTEGGAGIAWSGKSGPSEGAWLEPEARCRKNVDHSHRPGHRRNEAISDFDFATPASVNGRIQVGGTDQLSKWAAASNGPTIYIRRILSIALPLASSSTILSKYRISRMTGSSILSILTPQTTPVIIARDGFI